MKIFVFLGLFLCSNLSFSQKKIEDLKKNIKLIEDDSLKTANIATLAFHYRSVNIDSGVFYGQMALKRAKGKSVYNESMSFNALGIIYKNGGLYDKAIYNYRQSLRLRRKLQNEPAAAIVAMNIGKIYELKAQFDSSAIEYDYALRIFEQYYDSENKNFQSDSRKNLPKVLENLGVLYNKQGIEESSLAYHYWKRSLEEYYKVGKGEQASGVLNNMGLLMLSMDSLDSAMSYFKKSLSLKEELNNKRGQATTLLNIGDVYLLQQEIEMADITFQKAFKLNDEVGNKLGLGQSYVALSKIDRLANDFVQEKDKLLKAVEIFREVRAIDELSRAFLRLSSVMENLNNAKGALKAFRSYDSLNKSIFNEVKNEQIQELRVQHESEKSEQDLILQKSKNRNQTFILLILVLLIVVLTLRYYMVKKLARKSKKLHDQEVNQLIVNQELKMIQAMIDGQEKERARIAEDLHDRLGSTLSATSMHLDALDEDLVTGKSTDIVRTLLNKAIEDTRQISHNMLSGVLTKFGLIAALKDLKHTIEESNRISMSLEVNELDITLPIEKELHVYRVIQELVSNALKHAYAKHLTLSFKKTELGYQITFSDDGIGFDIDKLNRGIGLKNIASRLDRIKATHEIKPSSSGTTVIINMAA